MTNQKSHLVQEWLAKAILGLLCQAFLSGGSRQQQTAKHPNVFKAYSGKAAQCRQKVCSSKRPPELKPRSVRPNEVFENIACRISPE